MPQTQMKWIALVLAVLAAGCSGDKKTRPAEAVATLTTSVGEVQHRRVDTLTWNSAEQGLKLRHRDGLKTGAGARAVVTFEGGGKLEVDERSLVVVELPKAKRAGKAPRARVEEGTVTGVARPGAAPVQIVTADGEKTEIVARGSEPVSYRARVRKGKLEVAVLKGTAEVRSGGKSVQVKTRQVVEVKRRAISAPRQLLPYPALLAPAVNAKLPRNAPISLRWNAVPGAKRYRLQVATAVGFHPRLMDQSTPGTVMQLQKGRVGRTYYWRVASIDAKGHESEFGFARKFSVVEAAASQPASGPAGPPALLRPTHDTTIAVARGRTRPLLFSWRGSAKRYQLVIARDRRLRRVIVRRTVEGHKTSVRKWPRGTFYWGVYALEKNKRRPLFKKPRRLYVIRRKPPKVGVPGSIDWRSK